MGLALQMHRHRLSSQFVYIMMHLFVRFHPDRQTEWQSGERKEVTSLVMLVKRPRSLLSGESQQTMFSG